ncbi:hypothetical protein BXZ70DRAFT_911157 [Cristinia sonorae]|uniref:Uncharacterized protein n=1 Tax=Cristinia sonorae TaxID=1940300 RepID=A0A8K0UEP4_9AGAR|nr:hypothetical protein BXZ70DRAFT_911157 [Cristinia sonorae]
MSPSVVFYRDTFRCRECFKELHPLPTKKPKNPLDLGRYYVTCRGESSPHTVVFAWASARLALALDPEVENILMEPGKPPEPPPAAIQGPLQCSEPGCHKGRINKDCPHLACASHCRKRPDHEDGPCLCHNTHSKRARAAAMSSDSSQQPPSSTDGVQLPVIPPQNPLQPTSPPPPPLQPIRVNQPLPSPSSSAIPTSQSAPASLTNRSQPARSSTNAKTASKGVSKGLFPAVQARVASHLSDVFVEQTALELARREERRKEEEKRKALLAASDAKVDFHVYKTRSSKPVLRSLLGVADPRRYVVFDQPLLSRLGIMAPDTPSANFRFGLYFRDTRQWADIDVDYHVQLRPGEAIHIGPCSADRESKDPPGFLEALMQDEARPNNARSSSSQLASDRQSVQSQTRRGRTTQRAGHTGPLPTPFNSSPLSSPPPSPPLASSSAGRDAEATPRPLRLLQPQRPLAEPQVKTEEVQSLVLDTPDPIGDTSEDPIVLSSDSELSDPHSSSSTPTKHNQDQTLSVNEVSVAKKNKGKQRATDVGAGWEAQPERYAHQGTQSELLRYCYGVLGHGLGCITFLTTLVPAASVTKSSATSQSFSRESSSDNFSSSEDLHAEEQAALLAATRASRREAMLSHPKVGSSSRSGRLRSMSAHRSRGSDSEEDVVHRQAALLAQANSCRREHTPHPNANRRSSGSSAVPVSGSQRHLPANTTRPWPAGHYACDVIPFFRASYDKSNRRRRVRVEDLYRKTFNTPWASSTFYEHRNRWTAALKTAAGREICDRLEAAGHIPDAEWWSLLTEVAEAEEEQRAGLDSGSDASRLRSAPSTKRSRGSSSDEHPLPTLPSPSSKRMKSSGKGTAGSRLQRDDALRLDGPLVPELIRLLTAAAGSQAIAPRHGRKPANQNSSSSRNRNPEDSTGMDSLLRLLSRAAAAPSAPSRNRPEAHQQPSAFQSGSRSSRSRSRTPSLYGDDAENNDECDWEEGKGDDFDDYD